MINLDSIVELLAEQADTTKPWMTARSIAKRLGLDTSFCGEIESTLLAYFRACSENNKKSQVRYSTLPSIKTLEVLWGHTKAVGFRNVCDIHKTDVADDSLGIVDEIEAADVFISHSFKDYDSVMDIASHLQAKDIRPWLAETHIAKDEHINEQVIWGIRRTSCFALFLSQSALQSKWTGKEFQQAKVKKIRIIIIVNCADPVIKNLFIRRFSGQPVDQIDLNGKAYSFFENLLTTEDTDFENQPFSFVVYPQEHWIYFKELDMATHTLFPFEDLTTLIIDSGFA